MPSRIVLAACSDISPIQRPLLIGIVELWPGIRLQRDAAAELRRMADARGAMAWISPCSVPSAPLISRTKSSFDMKSLRNQTALERAKVSAPPGYSEHSTGFAIDVADLTGPKATLREF